MFNFYEKIYRKSPVLIQNTMISAYGYQWRKRRMGGIFKQEFTKAKARENYNAGQWLDYQDQQLQKLLLHSFQNVPYYNHSFHKMNLNENSLRKINCHSLYQLPVLTKSDLRMHGCASLLSSKKEKKAKFFASSGSTGTPTQILFSEAMHQRWFALFEARVRNWAGVNSQVPRGMIGGRRILPGHENNPPFYRYNRFEKQVYFSAYHISRKNAPDYLNGMQKHPVQYMTGYAMSNYFLARFFKELQLQPPSQKAVITSSEKLTDEMRTLLMEVYACKVYDSWSGLEACALVSECEMGSLHISPDAGLIELLDDDLQPVPYGKEGTVYCTGFLNYDQPLIRYNIGDRMILSGESCVCGRAMPVVQSIIGRSEETVIGKDGREMVRFHGVFNGLSSVLNAQVIQENLEQITVKVVPYGSLHERDAITIRERIKSQLGVIEINIEEVPLIPLNKNGKYQAVISKVKRS